MTNDRTAIDCSTPHLVFDMPGDVYHADPCVEPSLSQSVAHTLLTEYPRNAWRAHPRLGGQSRRTTRAMDAGSVMDQLVFGGGVEIVTIAADSFRTKAAQTERDEAQARGALVLLEREWAPMARTAELVKEKLRAELGEGYRAQASVFWQEVAGNLSPVSCRARLDALSADGDLIVDLKFGRVINPREHARHFWEMGYDMQRAAYVSAVRAVQGRAPEFLNLFVSSEGGEHPDMVLDSHTASMAEVGELRWQAAVDRWELCTRLRRFDPPFGSLDYLAAIEHCRAAGARTIIIDSFSHEHEGPGGMLETAEKWLLEKATRPNGSVDWNVYNANKLSSFIRPKADRVKLLHQGLLQTRCNFILCWRAKEKIKPVRGKEPEQLGWQPICSDEFFYEMTARFLLLPGADGRPEWNPAHDGEKAVKRLPEHFRQLFAGGRVQLTEATGEAMAKWATGDAGPSAEPESDPKDVERALTSLENAPDRDALKSIAAVLADMPWTKDSRARLKARSKRAVGASPKRRPREHRNPSTLNPKERHD